MSGANHRPSRHAPDREENAPAVAVPDPETEEVRLAMALNGGVSLAIWMGGCAVEVDSARRAHWGAEDQGFDPVKGGGSKRTTYACLCHAFKRELVIDIMTGASAGGVNGGLLAASMVSQRRLHPSYVRKQWLNLGDFLKLLHDSTDPTPRSLMQGNRFTEGLLQVFEELAGDESNAKREGLVLPHAQAERAQKVIPRLDVTVTDVRGSERIYRDAWGGTFSAREYRRRFRFREERDYTPKNLAAAARCSASFPAAFEPFRANQESWRLTAPSGTEPSTEERPWTIDGGLLDNAPIRAAIELIPTRAANRQVKRYLVYVNPESHGPLDPGSAGVGTSADGETPCAEPQLTDVAGYVISLPRKMPFVDQLDAIEDAVQKSSLISDGALPLLASPIETVHETATALLPPYASRRRLKSLRDLLGDSAAAARAYRALEDAGVELPWIPNAIDVSEPVRWDWGLSTAIRICHFLLDLIRVGIAGDADHREEFLDARVRLDGPLNDLQAAYAGAVDNHELISELRSPDSLLSANRTVAGLQGLVGDDQSVALVAARTAIRIFADLVAALGGALTLPRSQREGRGEEGEQLERMQEGHADEAENRVEVGVALLGEGWRDDADFRAARKEGAPKPGDDALTEPERDCLRRLLSIEVIRRAFSNEEPVDSAQELSFVQLTPDAPTPIFSCDPFSAPFPGSAESKLAGIRLGHFAGFLKRSWRANDFMWGRLDAAARIVDLLVDQARAHDLGFEEVAAELADGLVDDHATTEQRWLVAEALSTWDHSNAPDGAVEPPPPDELRPVLKTALVRDLKNRSGKAMFTRTVCTRAAQLEIVRAELPEIDRAIWDDAAAGSSTESLDFGKVDRGTGELPDGGGLKSAIVDVRRGQPLPVRLGRDEAAETTSDLTAQVAARAGFVTLAALRTAKLPGARALDLLRPPLLAVTGMSARGFLLRVPLVLGFWAAALYLTSRVVNTAEDRTAELASILSTQVLLAFVAALAVLGVAVLPLVRGLRRRWKPVSFAEFFAVLLIIVAGGGAAIVLALWFGDLTPAQLIVAPGFDPPPPDWVVDLAIVVAIGLPLTRTALLRKLPSRVLELTRRGAVSAVILAAVAVLISIWTFAELVDTLDEGPPWRTIAAVTALILPLPVCTAYLMFHNVVQRSKISAPSVGGAVAGADRGGPGSG